MAELHCRWPEQLEQLWSGQGAAILTGGRDGTKLLSRQAISLKSVNNPYSQGVCTTLKHQIRDVFGTKSIPANEKSPLPTPWTRARKAALLLRYRGSSSPQGQEPATCSYFYFPLSQLLHCELWVTVKASRIRRCT